MNQGFRRSGKSKSEFFRNLLGCIRTMSVRQLDLFSAIEAHLIRPSFDGEYSAQVPVTAAKSNIKNPT